MHFVLILMITQMTVAVPLSAYTKGNKEYEPKKCEPSLPGFKTSSRQNICMFSGECIQRKGKVVGGCHNSIFIGVCCQLPENIEDSVLDSIKHNNNNNLIINSDGHTMDVDSETDNTQSTEKPVDYSVFNPSEWVSLDAKKDDDIVNSSHKVETLYNPIPQINNIMSKYQKIFVNKLNETKGIEANSNGPFEVHNETKGIEATSNGPFEVPKKYVSPVKLSDDSLRKNTVTMTEDFSSEENTTTESTTNASLYEIENVLDSSQINREDEDPKDFSQQENEILLTTTIDDRYTTLPSLPSMSSDLNNSLKVTIKEPKNDFQNLDENLNKDENTSNNANTKITGFVENSSHNSTIQKFTVSQTNKTWGYTQKPVAEDSSHYNNSINDASKTFSATQNVEASVNLNLNSSMEKTLPAESLEDFSNANINGTVRNSTEKLIPIQQSVLSINDDLLEKYADLIVEKVLAKLQEKIPNMKNVEKTSNSANVTTQKPNLKDFVKESLNITATYTSNVTTNKPHVENVIKESTSITFMDTANESNQNSNVKDVDEESKNATSVDKMNVTTQDPLSTSSVVPSRIEAEQTIEKTSITQPVTPVSYITLEISSTTSTTVRPTTPMPKITPNADPRSICGLKPFVGTPRIVGGSTATFGKHPWQVLVYMVTEAMWWEISKKQHCGGVLISNKYVITAAHCKPSHFFQSLTVAVGKLDLSGRDEPLKSQTRKVSQIIVHDEYDPETFENDIALLKLQSPVKFNTHIIPICLPSKNDNSDYSKKLAVVTGWGKLKNRTTPLKLQELIVPVIENSVCQDMYFQTEHKKVIKDTFLCAGYADGQMDSCEVVFCLDRGCTCPSEARAITSNKVRKCFPKQGDSGGPLVLQRPDGRWTLIATVSHGINCAVKLLPGVYTRTTKYLSWIHSHTDV